jgi:phage-related minor tail protein
MDEEIERLVVSVRADTGAFARDVAEMRGQLEGPLGEGAAQAGRLIEGALLRAVRTGKIGFDDLKRVALAAMADIAAAAVRNGLGALGGGAGGGAGQGLAGLAASLIGALLGAPGRAVGGGVAPGRPYLVGERGPELFVPTASGRIDPPGRAAGREVRVTLNIHAPQAEAPAMLARSARQVARAVRRALEQAED